MENGKTTSSNRGSRIQGYNDNEQVLSMSQAAEFLGISMGHMQKIRKHIPVLRLGRSVKFFRSDLMNYLQSVRERSN